MREPKIQGRAGLADVGMWVPATLRLHEQLDAIRHGFKREDGHKSSAAVPAFISRSRVT